MLVKYLILSTLFIKYYIMKKFILFLVIYVLAFASCKKDKKDDNCSLSEANLAGSYKITSIKYKASASSPEEDYIDQFLEPCEKDDIITLNTDHTYVYTDAGTICSPNGNDNGTWGLSGNVILVDGDPATVENFNCSSFTAVATDFDIAGDKIIFTYAKQ